MIVCVTHLDTLCREMLNNVDKRQKLSPLLVSQRSFIHPLVGSSYSSGFIMYWGMKPRFRSSYLSVRLIRCPLYPRIQLQRLCNDRVGDVRLLVLVLNSRRRPIGKGRRLRGKDDAKDVCYTLNFFPLCATPRHENLTSLLSSFAP